MSENESSGNESTDEFSCPVEWCEYTSHSDNGIAAHFGKGHDDGEKKEIALDEIQRLADQLGRLPRQEDMDDRGKFSSSLYRLFDSWNAALKEAGFEPEFRYNIPDEELLDEICRLATELGHTPRQTEMNSHGAFDSKVYYTRFGGWGESLKQAGFEPLHRTNLSSEDLIAELVQLAEELGRTPHAEDMDSRGKFNHRNYIRCFGTWNAALRSAGLELNRRYDHTSQELVSELQRLADELGRIPTKDDMNSYGAFSTRPYITQFGGWNTSLEAAGFEPKYRTDIPDGDLLDELRRLDDELDHTPRQRDMSSTGRYSPDTYYHRFGSWSAALGEVGIEPNLAEDWVLSGKEHPCWKDGFNGGYGPNWEEQRKARIKRDGSACVVCGVSEEDHRRTYGFGLYVHHIVRKENFRRDDGTLDYEQANRIQNLRTMCCNHHPMWEGIPVAPQPNTCD